MNTALQSFFVLIVIILIFSTKTFAQISITNNDILGLIGNSQTAESDTTGSVTVNVGSAGANQSWDLSSVTVQSFVFTLDYLSPQGTPYENDFPTANFVSSFSDTFGTSYTYAEVTSSNFSSLGSAIYIPSLDTTLFSFTNDDRVPLPLIFNSSWVSTEADTFGDPATFAFVSLDTTTNTVDGWGTLQLPAGSFDCLRVRFDTKSTEITIVAGNVISVVTTNSIGYTWISKDNFILAEAESQDGDTNPNFTDAAEFQRLLSPVTGIEDQAGIELNPQNIRLFQNYPNPFNPSTTISYQLSNISQVKIEILDIVGKKVAVLIDQKQQPGYYSINFDGSNLANGIYFYRIHTGTYSDIKKMVLMK